MNRFNRKTKNSSTIVGSGLVVLDIIINNGSKKPVFSAGGTCGNVLAGLSFLGWDSTAISRAGKDIAGEILIKDFLKSGVNVNHITKEEGVSTPRIVEKLKSNGKYAKHSFLLRCPTCGAYLPSFRSPRLDVISEILSKPQQTNVYFFDRATPGTLKLARHYRESGALIFFEPCSLKDDDKFEEAISLSHILKYSGSNKKEISVKNDKDPFLKKIKSYSPNLIIRTLGVQGLFFNFKGEKKWWFQKSFKLNELYDTCGAGDWCTVGLLFHLQKLFGKNRIPLIELLKHKDLVRASLNFAQALAALSCMFIGARGISNSLDRVEVLRKVRSCINKKSSQQHLPIILLKKHPVNAIRISKNKYKSNTCPTCLLT